MAEFHTLPSSKNKESKEWTIWNQQAETTARSVVQASMPTLHHLSRTDYQTVYEPAEDTYLLLDALLHEFEQGVFDVPRMRDNEEEEDDTFVVLEIGCGTGVPSVWFRQQWAQRYPNCPLRSIVTDINPRALQVAVQTDECNNWTTTTTTTTGTDGTSINTTPHNQLCSMEIIHCDLATALLEKYAASIDVILFNPPYVVTPDDEVVDFSRTTLIDMKDNDSSIIAAAWAGGFRGRRVLDRALPQLQHLLRGTAYVVTVDDNQPWELANLCREHYNLHMHPLLRRKAYNEYLTIQKIQPYKSEMLE
jgi:release factor glutamine methyltransferase